MSGGISKGNRSSRRARLTLQGLDDRVMPSVTVVGGLSNFDCTNGTGHTEDEFEIELPSVDPASIASFWANTPAYKGSGFGLPIKSQHASSDGVAGHLSTYVNYKRPGVTSPAGFTEHFGIHFVNPTFLPPQTIYRWKNAGVVSDVSLPSMSLTTTPNGTGGVTVTPVVTNNTPVPLVVQFHTTVVAGVTPTRPNGVDLGDMVDTSPEVEQAEAEHEAGDNGLAGVQLDPGQVLGVDGEAHDPTDPIIVDPQGWIQSHPGEDLVSFGEDLNTPGDAAVATLVVTDTAGNPVGEILSAVNTAVPATLTLPANQTVEATSPAGATDPAAFTAFVTGTVSGTPTIVYAVGNTPITSSYVFPLGVTTVTVTATDAIGQTASGTFTVTVRDTTPPVLTLPANQTAEATSASGATAAAFTASATDLVTTSPTITYAVGTTAVTSSYVFPLGTTTVRATARDAAGNSSSGTFTVTVRDTTPPVLTLPANLTVPLATAAGSTAPAAFMATARDAVTASPTIVYAVGTTPITSSYVFPLGVTTVRGTATDAAGNASTGTFTVTVTGPTVTVTGAPTAPFVEEAHLHLVATATEPGYTGAFAFTWTITRMYNGVTTTVATGSRTGARAVIDFETEQPGHYTVNVVATDSRGFASMPVSIAFDVLPEPHEPNRPGRP